MVILGTGFYTGFYTGRVWVFLIKPGPVSGFFFLNPYPTLFLIGPGKTRPIRVGPDRVPADRVKIAIPNSYSYSYIITICITKQYMKNIKTITNLKKKKKLVNWGGVVMKVIGIISII